MQSACSSMANPLFSPTRPHFFQPLLPGFHRNLTVPVAFFLRHIKGRDEGNAAELGSDRRERRWVVKMEGRRFTDGWEEFALAHDLKVGDFLVFRHEGNLVFHVTAFEPSCCQIQYAPRPPNDDDENHYDNDDDDDIDLAVEVVDAGNLWRKKKVKNGLKTQTDPSDHTCFRAVLTAAGLREDTLCVPRSFARQNGLNRINSEIVVMNRQGRSWKLVLKYSRISGRFYIKRGWRDFCSANGQKAGDFFRLKLVKSRKTTPVLRMFPEEESLKTEENKILSTKSSRNSSKNSWKCLKITEKKTLSRQASSLPLQNRFVRLTLTPSRLHRSVLRLPKSFTKANGLEKSGQKITLLDKEGREWPTHLHLENLDGRVSIGKGWRDFFAANGVKVGESFMLELIWEDTHPTLNFCSKI